MPSPSVLPSSLHSIILPKRQLKLSTEYQRTTYLPKEALIFSAGRGINSGLRSSIANVLALTPALTLDFEENDVIGLVAYPATYDYTYFMAPLFPKLNASPLGQD
ncbi:hypothetical protein EG328_002520 [Venturia inaequalis]|uniref:Uncharacterized protein n=1 Tax=Venturia inaequalis TaxID=5025 RepID=A0A8H3Z671_VENIN|nr:hypothetical protein EG328_002520 [Venturia inaequalis]